MALPLRLLGLLLLAGSGAVAAGEGSPFDAENPRNVRFEGQVIPYVRSVPCMPYPAAITWMEGQEAIWGVVHGDGSLLENASPDDVAWTFDGRARRPSACYSASPPEDFVQGMPWTPDRVRHQVVATTKQDRCEVVTDAFRVLLLVERKTLRKGDRRFGSFVRRFRKSLDDLNALFASSVHGSAPRGIEDRFRLDAVIVYDRGESPPPEFLEHPEQDVAILCDEGGPLEGFSIPAYSIGHNFTGPLAHAGLWSSWGEQALWHELLHFRGVQDFTSYEAAAGALPGRRKRRVPLPRRYAIDLMASPFQPPVLTEYTVVMANVRRGVARVGAPDDTENVKFGTMWNWLPARIDLHIRKAVAPVAGAPVRWWRSLPQADLPSETPEGIAAGRPPDGATTTDASGKAVLSGDLLGRTRPPAERGRWLLVEIEIAGERRFEIVYGLDLNLAYAKGDKYGTTLRWDFDDLLRLEGALPPDR